MRPDEINAPVRWDYPTFTGNDFLLTAYRHNDTVIIETRGGKSMAIPCDFQDDTLLRVVSTSTEDEVLIGRNGVWTSIFRWNRP